MKKRLRIAVVAVGLIAAVVIGNVIFRNHKENSRIRLSGNIEVTQVDLSFKIPGRLARRLVDEGQRVTRGELVAELEPGDWQVEVRKAEAELAYARSALAELEAGSRPEEIQRAQARVTQAEFALKELETGSRSQEITAAEADLRQARAAADAAQSRLKLAQADFDRYAKLFKAGGISRQALDGYQTQLETAQKAYDETVARVENARQQLSLRQEGPRNEQIRQARAALTQAEAEYALIKAGPRKETIDQARAREAAVREALNLARLKLEDTHIRAPFDGVVLSKSAEPGAYLNPGTPVVTVAQMERVWLRAFVTESDLGRIRLGQTAAVSTDADPDQHSSGTISFIASEAEFTPKSVQTFEERVDLMYRVKIDLDNPDGIFKPGMPADAVIEIDHES